MVTSRSVSQAAALSAACSAGVAGGQAAEDRLELALERPELVELAVNLSDPLDKEPAQTGLQPPALAIGPRRYEPGDVLQGHADTLGPGDEGQFFEGRLVEDPVSVGGPSAGTTARPARSSAPSKVLGQQTRQVQRL